MVEAVGLAASVAGLLRITSQLLKGILFIKGFLNDTKNAPEDIHMLSDEVELLSSAAQRTESLLVMYEQNRLELNLEAERKALKKYTDMVSKLGSEIDKDVQKFSEGKGRWWDRMKTAGKKNGLAEYMTGIERAKTLVMDVEMKIMIDLQHDHRNILNGTNRSLEALQSTSESDTTTLNQIHVNSNAIKTWTGTVDATFANLSRDVENIKSSLGGLVLAIQQLNITQHHELSNLDAILESAVMRGLTRHNDKLRTDPSPELVKTVVSIRKRLTNVITTPLFDIGFVTKEIQQRPTSPIQGVFTVPSEESPATSQCFTTYKIRIKPLSWLFEIGYEPGRFHTRYYTSFHKCLRFRIYNIVPWDSPIMEACRNFDLPEVRRLFEAGHASPQDCCYPCNDSLVAIVFMRLFGSQCRLSTEATKGVALLKFLIHCLGGDIGFPGGHFFSVFNFKSKSTKTQHSRELVEMRTEAFRLGLAHSPEDPFQGRNVAQRLSITFSQTPIYSVLMAQQKWWIETQVEDFHFNYGERTYFIETNLQMLNDISGLCMQKAIARGDDYIPFMLGYRPGAGHSPIHSLLKIAAMTFREDLHKCVLARLSTLIRSQYQPHDAYYVHDFSQSFYPNSDTPAMPLSCTGYAHYLHLTDLWQSALEAALWTPAEIQHLFDADLYAGVPELLSGALVYQTRDDQRATFMHQLLRGDFMGLEDGMILTISIALQNELGVWWAGVNQMIRDVEGCFKSRIVPGGWPTDQNRGLVPGIDFKLPSGSKFDDRFDNVKDWKCVQEIWDGELDGHIPHDCSLPRHKYADTQSRLEEKCRHALSQNRVLTTLIKKQKS